MKHFILALLAVTIIASCSNYGKKVKSNHIEVFYKDGVTESQAQQTADLLFRLDNQGDNENKPKKSFQLSANGDTIICKMVVNSEKANDVPDGSFVIIGNNISDSAFNGKPVNMVLTDNKFKPLRTIFYSKLSSDAANFGEKITSGNIEVYIKEGISAEEANELATYLEREVGAQSVISFQIGKNELGQYLLRMVTNKDKADDLSDDDYYKMAEEVSKNVFDDGPVVFQLTNEIFEPFKTVRYNTP